MVHVRREAIPSMDGPDIDNGLGGNPSGHETDVPGQEFCQPQQLDAEHIAVKVERLLEVVRVHHHMVESDDMHGSLPRVFPRAWWHQTRSVLARRRHRYDLPTSP